MRILFVAAEATPWIKTGGLADVVGALPGALAADGADVRLILPLYRRLRSHLTGFEGPVAAGFVPFGEQAEELRVWSSPGSTPPTLFLDIPAAFDRDAIYGEQDDPRRFVLFSRGVLETIQYLREVEHWQADVVHCHDWHSALVVNYLKTRYGYTFGHVRTVFTIHNLAYQGRCSRTIQADAGLGEYGAVEDSMGSTLSGTFNFMARGILNSDEVTTVSPAYANEIATPEFGEGLDGLLRFRYDRLHGILNGIDTELLDPATDVHIAANYDADDTAGKRVCKLALQRECELAVDAERPILGVVSRLTGQKGLDLLYSIMPWLLQNTRAQLVMLGSGDRDLEDAFRHLAKANQDRVAVTTGFDAALAQRIYAGSDCLLMPSRFEPCGISQLIALRYGTVPVVRATGGLADTVKEGWDGNGFRFHPFDGRHFADAIARALASYADTSGWAILRSRGMREDHSWSIAARRYARVYQDALNR